MFETATMFAWIMLAENVIFGILSAYKARSSIVGINEKLTSLGGVAYLSAPLMGKYYVRCIGNGQ
jgi:hypothetical protein